MMHVRHRDKSSRGHVKTAAKNVTEDTDFTAPASSSDAPGAIGEKGGAFVRRRPWMVQHSNNDDKSNKPFSTENQIRHYGGAVPCWKRVGQLRTRTTPIIIIFVLCCISVTLSSFHVLRLHKNIPSWKFHLPRQAPNQDHEEEMMALLAMGETFPTKNISSWIMRSRTIASTTLVTKETHPHYWDRFEQQQQKTNSTCSSIHRASVTCLDRNSISFSNSNIATIVVQLRGEMANHLSAIAHGRAIQLYALASLGMETKLVFVPQELSPPQQKSIPKTTTNTLLSPKGKATRETLHQCFPILRLWNALDIMEEHPTDHDPNDRFPERRDGLLASPEAFHQRQTQQSEWLQGLSISSSLSKSINLTTPTQILSILGRINGRKFRPRGFIKPVNPQDFRQPVQELDLQESLYLFQQLWLIRQNDRQTTTKASTADSSFVSSSLTATASSISLPFLYSESMDNWWLLDRYYEEFRQIFSFWSFWSRSNPTSTMAATSPQLHHPTSHCCREVPYPDESVFHFRNFESELPRMVSVLGYEDVTPNQTATVLFGHLQPGDRVAIATRTYDEDNTTMSTPRSTPKNSLLREHIQALEQRGIQVRVLSGQSGMQDFCFLAHAQKELIGNVRSTYAVWATLLGNAKLTKLYTVDSPGLRNRFGGGHPWYLPTNHQRFEFPFTHPELKRRIHFQLIERER